MTIQTTITGNIGKAPELRYVATQEKGTQPVLNFSVQAASSRFNQNIGKWETIGEPIWIKIALWGNQAEKWADTLNAGTRVALQGNLKRTTDTDKNGQIWENLELTGAHMLGTTPKPDPTTTTQTETINTDNEEPTYDYADAPF